MHCGATRRRRSCMFSNRFGFVLISHVGNAERAALVTRSLNSLIKTKITDTDIYSPALEIMYNPSSKFDYGQFTKQLDRNWLVFTDTDKASGLNGLVSIAADLLIEEVENITHVGFLWDDFYYHPEWGIKLNELVLRHPDAKAWSIYRSSYTRHHRIIGGQSSSGDCLMTMHDGVGLMTVEEWKEYGASKRADFACPESMGGGNTIDIHHAYERPGDRWATGRDYAQNLGVHANLGRLDQAIDFVGFVE